MKKKFDEVIAFLGGKKAFGITAGIIVGVYLIAGIAITIINVLGYRVDLSDKTVSKTETAVEVTATPAPEPEPTEEPEPSGPVTLKKGESVTMDDTTYCMKSCDTDYKLSGYSRKPDGYNYMKVEFFLTNNSESTKYYSWYDFDCYVDNVECDKEYSGSNGSKNTDSGRSALISVVWIVPKDAESIEIECEPSSGEKIIFKVK